MKKDVEDYIYQAFNTISAEHNLKSLDDTILLAILYTFQMALAVKNLPANAGDARDTGSVPGSGRSPGVGNGNPLLYSFLESSMDRGAWRATVFGVPRLGHD